MPGPVTAEASTRRRRPPSGTECRLRLARAGPEREPLPSPEHLGSKDKHGAANEAERQRRRVCCSRYACRTGRFEFNLFRLECLQRGLTATGTPEQRADPAFSVKLF